MVFVVYEQIFIIIGYCPAVNLIYKPIKSYTNKTKINSQKFWILRVLMFLKSL